MTIWWTRLEDGPGLDACTVATAPSLSLAGTVVTHFWGRPASVEYMVDTDGAGVTRMAEVQVRGVGLDRTLSLQRGADGRWWVDGVHVPALDGFLDVDLGVTPATNTLPIRRLGLAVGGHANLTAAWVRFPELTVSPLAQRYTRLDHRRYRYESIASGFTAVLEVDADGVVVTYQDLWRRVTPSSPAARDPALESLTANDFEALSAVVDSWWGKSVGWLLQRFMTEHWSDTSFVVREGGRPIAFLLGFISPAHPEVGYVHMLGIDPDHQGQHWGRRLYEAFFDVARARGASQVRAITSPSNRQSIAFHQALGFSLEPSGHVAGGLFVHPNYDGHGHDRVRFVRPLREAPP